MALTPASTSSKPALLALSVLVIGMVSLSVALFTTASPPIPEPELGPGRTDARYDAGQAVEIWQNGRWLPGKIQAVGDGRYFVFYDGFSVSWNEWVGPARLRPASR